MVLDASAVIAVMSEEPGAEIVRQFIPGAFLSVVNLAEVLAKLSDRGIGTDHGSVAVDALELQIRPMTQVQAVLSADMRQATRASGLSIADRACLALAKEIGSPVLTADRVWATVADAVGVRVQLIR